MKVAVSVVPGVPDDSVRVGEAAAESGLAFLGIADTPQLRAGAFPALQHVLSRIFDLPLATFVTNPVLRHPSVLAADFAALDHLYPGRVIAGLGTGDSAVRSVGLAPATSQQVADAARLIAQRTSARVPILMATSGLRLARHFPVEATGVIIGGGLDQSWLRSVIATAEAAAGHRLDRWAFAVGAPSTGIDLDSPAGRRVLNSAVTISRHALARHPVERGVPAGLRSALARVYAGYDVGAYGDPDGVNVRLLEREPAVRDYLLDRFALLGEPAAVSDRLRKIADDVGLDGIVLTTSADDPLTVVRGVAAELAANLKAEAHS